MAKFRAAIACARGHAQHPPTHTQESARTTSDTSVVNHEECRRSRGEVKSDKEECKRRRRHTAASVCRWRPKPHELQKRHTARTTSGKPMLQAPLAPV